MVAVETEVEGQLDEVNSFLLDPTSKAPTLDDLADRALTTSHGGEMLLALLEDTGHRPSEADISGTQGIVKQALVIKRKDVMQEVEQTRNTYRSLFFKGPGKGKGLNVDAVERLYDATERFDDTPVLSLLGEIRRMLPEGAERARVTAAEADRIARLMIAQHMGSVVVGSLIVDEETIDLRDQSHVS